jgi:hypothetical protein
MRFPLWVDGKRMSKAARASARLKYMLSMLAAHVDGRQSMRALGDRVGLNHSTLSLYIRRGSFSESAARKIEEKIGRETIPFEYLVAPLDIAATTT